MNNSDVNSIIPLIAAGCYTLLLITPFTRRSQQEKQTRWLLLFLVLSITWEFLLFFAAEIPRLSNLPIKVLLVSTTVLGMTTAVYIDWSRRRKWSLLSVGAVLVVLLVDVFLPTYAFPIPGSRLPSIMISTLLSYFAWFILSSYILIKTWRNYRRTFFPWHANRLLYWFASLLITFIGEALLLTALVELMIAGQIVRFIGALSLTYAVSSYRIFDIRTRSQRSLAFIIITLFSALPVTGALLLGIRVTQNLPPSATVIFTLIIITLGFFLYQPIRHVVERVTYYYLLGERVNTSQVVRNYSQAISRTLDVQQLSPLIIGLLSELLQTSRGALMLVTRVSDGFEIAPIPAMGHIPRQTIKLAPDSLFIKTLTQQHQPLLQYDIDFNPAYAGMSQAERTWFRELTMEVYAPVNAGKEIAGLIAIGPKISAVPYQPSELDLVQTLADQTVVALQNARLYSELGLQNDKIRRLNVDLVTQNERLEIMDKVKSDFITIASHELRTPLTQVKGYADILAAMNEENILTREQTREIISHINRATLRLEGLITAMLDASQLDVDGMQLTFVETKLDTILRLAIEPLIFPMRERRISFKTDGVQTLPPIRADFKRLVQAFTNLVGNAVKYTPDHGAITVRAELVPSNGSQDEFLEITITDTGIGIAPQFHELIFEKFFRIGDPQLHSTGSTKFKGAGPGLGLPIAKGVIEAHGGRIWVESEGEDEERLPGSAFHIILPVRPPGSEIKSNIEPIARPAYLIG
jgi:signal transduction histidine kinase